MYGDSNVYGANNATNVRMPYNQRWVNRLKKLLDGQCEIIANGVSGRVAGDYRTDKLDRNGKADFSHEYTKAGIVDIVVIALGTNDLQDKYQRSIDDILNDLLWYHTVARGARIVYLLPANFDNSDEVGPHFNERAQALRKDLISRKDNLGDTIVMNNVGLSDGLHFSDEGHAMVAEAVAERLRALL